MKAWAGYTIKDRCALFHAQFKDKVIAATTLARFYKKHGVKRKRVKLAKELSLKAQEDFYDNKQRIIDQY